VYTYIYACMCIYIYTYIHICIYIYIFTYKYICIYVYTNIHKYIYSSTSTYIYIYTHIHTHTHMHTYVHTPRIPLTPRARTHAHTRRASGLRQDKEADITFDTTALSPSEAKRIPPNILRTPWGIRNSFPGSPVERVGGGERDIDGREERRGGGGGASSLHTAEFDVRFSVHDRPVAEQVYLLMSLLTDVSFGVYFLRGAYI